MKRSERPGRGERRVAGLGEVPPNTIRGRASELSARSAKPGPQVETGKNGGVVVKKRTKKSLRGGRIGFASRKRKRPKPKAENNLGAGEHHKPRSGLDRPFTPPGNEAAKTSSLISSVVPFAVLDNLNPSNFAMSGEGHTNGTLRGGSKRSRRVAERAAAAASVEEPEPEPEPFKKPRLALVLLRKEIDADFMAISGRRAPKRKRKSKAKLGTGHLSLCRSLSFKY